MNLETINDNIEYIDETLAKYLKNEVLRTLYALVESIPDNITGAEAKERIAIAIIKEMEVNKNELN